MGLLDIFETKKYKKEIEEQAKKIEEQEQRIEGLIKQLSPEQQELDKINQEIASSKEKLTSIKENIDKEINDGNIALEKLQSERIKVTNDLNKIRDELIVSKSNLEFQDYGLFEPEFEFCNSEEYKYRISKIRDEQKEQLKFEIKQAERTTWTVNQSKAKGVKMVKDITKLLLRAFNSECDSLVEKVKYNNFDTYSERMRKTAETISRLGSVMEISITQKYLQLKLDELKLAFEYRMKKQQEKEEQREIREQMRAEAKLQKEIEEARKKVEKEQSHYENALKQINKKISESKEDDMRALLDKKKEIENQLEKIETNLKEIDYREANQRAGYVYVISNVGSFGENVYKIGMTRRLDPQDRVDELGDASVPFRFDVHAMIFSDDAPKLENALHKAFENKKVNMINHRREFFNVSLDEIKQVVRNNYDKTVEFFDVADAEEWHMSQDILKKLEC